MVNFLREARLTYGAALWMPSILGVAIAAWIFGLPEQTGEHATIAIRLIEFGCGPIFAIVGARLFGHDANRGVVEAIATRGSGYPLRNFVRLVVLAVAAVLALLIPAAAISQVLGTSPPILLLIWIPSAFVFGTAAAYLGALVRSEAAGAAVAMAWWLCDLYLGRGLAHSGPASFLSLVAYGTGNPDWIAVKIGQTIAAVVIGACVIMSSSRFVRMALVRSSG